MLRLLLIIKNLFAFFRIVFFFIFGISWTFSTAFILGFVFMEINHIIWGWGAVILILAFGAVPWFRFGAWIGGHFMEYSERFYSWIDKRIFNVCDRMVG